MQMTAQYSDVQRGILEQQKTTRGSAEEIKPQKSSLGKFIHKNILNKKGRPKCCVL